jgi:hypothetical protein
MPTWLLVKPSHLMAQKVERITVRKLYGWGNCAHKRGKSRKTTEIAL